MPSISHTLRLGNKHIHDFGLRLLPKVQALGLQGIPFSEERRQALLGVVRGRMEQLHWELSSAGLSHPSSPPALARDMLRLGVSLTKRTPGGEQFSTDLDVLARLNYHENVAREAAGKAARFPWLPGLMDYKRLFKAQSNLVGIKPCRDGRVRTALRSTGTETGRYSSAGLAWCPICKEADHGMNAQNVAKPIPGLEHIDIRSCFVAPEGWLFVERDHSQLELRLMAYLTNCQKMIERFESGESIHRANALEWFEEGYTETQYTLGKNVYFGCVPMDTQALTRNGWRTYTQLSVGEDILTYNAMTGMKEWAPIEHLTHTEAEVIEMRHNYSFCVRATANHRWFVKKRKRLERDGKVFWAKPYLSSVIETTAEINKESNIITNAPMTPDTGEDRELPVNKKFGHDWVKEVLSMTSAQRKAFLLGFMLADGHLNKRATPPYWMWSQNKTEISEGLLVASYLEHPGNLYITDKESKTPMVLCRLSKKSHVTGQRLRKCSLGVQPVWCPTTRNGSWVMRQGNTITITGNSQYGGGPRALQIAMAKKGTYIPESAIEEIQLKIFTSYPEIKPWQDQRRQEFRAARAAKLPAIARNVFGRTQVLLDHDPTRAGLSMEIQGSAADIMSFTLDRLDPDLRDYLVANIHDAFLGLAPEQDARWLLRVLRAEMERPVWLPHRFAVFPTDAKMGRNWGAYHVANNPEGMRSMKDDA